MAGKRYNKGKMQYHLLPQALIDETVKVMMEGAKKYSPNNWKGGGEQMKFSVLLDCLDRHIRKFKGMEDFDDETGCHHLAHAVCNLVFIYWYQMNVDKFPNQDDRHEWYDKYEKANLVCDPEPEFKPYPEENWFGAMSPSE